MRKNILAVIILAATLINLTLTAVMMFTFIPYTKNANTLVKNILGVLDLELESPLPGDYTAQYKLEDLEVTIDNIALKRNWIVSGGRPDSKRAAQNVLNDFRVGRLGKLTLDIHE